MRYLSLMIVLTLSTITLAVPPPPAEFAEPHSPPKPAPFLLRYIDQGQNDPRLKGYETPEGFKLEIVATDPTVINPVGMTFSPDGTLYVLEWKPDPYSDGRWFEFKETFRYRDGSTKQVATMKKFVGDPLKELTYNPNTGEFDAAKVVIVDELPSTVLYHDGWIYLTGRGTVRRYRQSKPGGLWDIKETIAQGFCGFHHHQVSGLTIGHDGKLYITSGDDDNFVEGSDGSRATVLRCGAVFRCNLDGSEMETFSIGYRNPYRDLAYDENFNWFHTDNDNEDGSRFTGCRIMHIPEGADYGWRLRMGARCCLPDHERGAIAGERPGKMPPMIKTGRGSPAGLLIYNDTRLPEHYRSLLYYPDVFRKLVRAYKTEPKGASFEIVGEFELIRSNDPLFRPCQMITGPDGAIYICDWRTDSGGAGKLWGDGKNGRIYRLSWSGTKTDPVLPLRPMNSWAKIRQQNDTEIIKSLSAPDQTDRIIARDELIRRGERSRQILMKPFLTGHIPPAGQLVAMSVLQSFWNNNVETVFQFLMNNKNENIRRLAVEALGLHGHFDRPLTRQAILKATNDANLAVRRSAALALARCGESAAAGDLVALWRADTTNDVFLQDGYVRAIERIGKPGIEKLLEAADRGDPVLRDRVVNVFTSFRTRPAFDLLGQMLQVKNLTPGQRAELVRSATNYLLDPMPSLEPIAEYFAKRPTESPTVLMAVVEVLAANDRLNSPSGIVLVNRLLTADDEVARGVAIGAVERVRLAAALPNLLKILDHPQTPLAERQAALKAVRVAGNASAIPAVRKILDTTSEKVTFRAEALRTLAGLDPQEARKVAIELLDQKESELLDEVTQILGANKAGAKLLGERFLAKKLPAEHWQRVSEALRKFTSDPVIAKLNSEVQKGGLLLSTSPADLAKVREMVKTKGDPLRGRELYLNSKKLACVTCHRLEGIGGQVGPDLTRVWDTQSVDKLLESIAQPSKEIKEGYQAFRLDTLSGQVYTGLKISESKEEIVLREATGRDVRVLRTDLDQLTPSKISLMPDDVISQLTYEQFIDLIAFLKDRTLQESLRGQVFEFAVVSGVTINPKNSNPLKIVLDRKETPKESLAWQSRSVDPKGLLSLTPVKSSESNDTFALTYVYSPKKQKASVWIRSSGPLRVWIRQELSQPKKVSEPMAEVKFDVELPEGWTPVLVKLPGSSSQTQFGLRFVGEGIRTAIKRD